MNTFAIIAVVSGLCSALIIAFDLIGHRQNMKIMNAVWVLTGLWAGCVGLLAYYFFGRHETGAMKDMQMPENGPSQSAEPVRRHNENPCRSRSSSRCDMRMGAGHMIEVSADSKTDAGVQSDKTQPDSGNMMDMPENAVHEVGFRSVVLSTLHCGAGCTLADIIGECILFLVPFMVFGNVVYSGWILDYVLALIIGVGFQLAAIRSMQRISVRDAIRHAVKADFLSLTFWQIGMCAWMALAFFVFFPHGALVRGSWMFWFMMQIAMFVGFLFACPVNIFLIKRGIKSGM